MQTGRNGSRTFAFQRAAIEHALKYPGCPICQVLGRSEERAIFLFLSEGMSRRGQRERFVRGGAFCTRHYAVAAGLKTNFVSGNFELAFLFKSLLNNVTEKLLENTGSDINNTAAASQIRQSCVFCADLPGREDAVICSLERLLDEPRFKRQFGERPICRRHLTLAASVWTDYDKRIWLLGQSSNYRTKLRNDIRQTLTNQDDVDERLLYAQTLEAIRFLVGADPTGALPRDAK